MILPLDVDEYARFKVVLNHARHPAFVGRTMFGVNARSGGAHVLVVDGVDVGVALVQTRRNVLTVLSVIRAAQGCGHGGVLLDYLMPNWIRATSDAVAYFLARGYSRLTFETIGRKLTTVLLVRSSLLELSGRLVASRTKSAD